MLQLPKHTNLPAEQEPKYVAHFVVVGSQEQLRIQQYREEPQ